MDRQLKQVLRGALATALLLFLVSIASAQEKRYDVPIGGSPQTGPSNAPVTLIEFIDFQ